VAVQEERRGVSGDDERAAVAAVIVL